MRLLIISITLIVVPSISDGQVPSCIKSLESKIISFEKGVDQLEDLAVNGTEQQFGNTLRRNNTKEKGIRNYLENCKKSNPDYNYSDVEAKIEKVVARFQAIAGKGSVVKEETKKSDPKPQHKVSSDAPEVEEAKPISSPAARPSCLKMVDSKLKSLEKGIIEMEGLSNDAYKFELARTRTEPKVNGLAKYIENCKQNNSSYNYGEIDSKIISAFTRYETLVEKQNSVQADLDVAKKQIDKLDNFISYIDAFPHGELRADEKKNYKYSDTEKFLEMAKNDPRNLGYKKDNYLKALEMVKTSEFENRAYQHIDAIYAEDAQTAVKALNAYLSDFIFIGTEVFPNVDRLNNIQSYIQKLVGKKQADQSKALAAITVSDFHKQNLNRILFTSNLSLNPENARASDFKTAFQPGESIKAIAYLDNVYNNIYGRTNEPAFKLNSSVNSGQIMCEGFKKSDGSKSYIVFYIAQDGVSYRATKGDNPTIMRSMEFLSKFAPRVHSVEVNLDSYMGVAQGDSPERDVRGTFTIDMSNSSGLAKMKDHISTIKDKALASVTLPKAGMNNGSYEKELVKMFNSIGWEEQFTRAIIGSSSFGYKKNYLDQVTGRTLQVYMISKKSDGGCMYQDFTVIQEKVGSDWAPFKRLSTGSQKDISCSRL